MKQEQIYEELRNRLPPPVIIVMEPVKIPLKKDSLKRLTQRKR